MTTAESRSSRRVWRRLAIGALVVFIPAAVWFAIELRWAVTAEPVRDSAMVGKWHELRSRHVTEGENAWPILIEIVDELNEIERATLQAVPRPEGTEMHRYFPDSISYLDVYDDDHPAEAIAPEREAIERIRVSRIPQLLEEAAACSHAIAPYQEEDAAHSLFLLKQGLAGQSPGDAMLAGMRRLTWALRAMFELALDADDVEEAVWAATHIAELSRLVATDVSPSRRTVGEAIGRSITYHLTERVATNRVRGDIAAALLAALPEKIERPALSHTVRVRHLVARDILKRIHSGPGWGGGRRLVTAEESLKADYNAALRAAISPELPDLEDVATDPYASPLRNLTWWRYPRLVEMERWSQTLFDHLAAEAEKPRRVFEEQTWAVSGLDAKEARYVKAETKQDWLLKAMTNRDHLDMKWRGMRLMLAIEVFRDAHGRVPQALDDLVNVGIIDRLPTDPLSGQSFGYRRLDDDPHGREFIVYSFGLGGEDAGGREHEHDRYGRAHALFNADTAREYDSVLGAPESLCD